VRGGRSDRTQHYGVAVVQLISELKRRNVFRVAAAYAVVGWLLIEISDTIFPNLGLPPWTVTLVIALVALGLPVALVLAWAFELTPDGVRRTAAADAEAATVPPARRGLDRWIVAGLAAVIGVLLVERLWFAGRDPAPQVAQSAPGGSAPDTVLPSIAVLPFDNYSPDPTDAYFAGGMTEEIAGQLARLAGLRVMSRTAVARALEGSQSLGEVATALGVGSVLEGSVRKAGDRVRINAQLVDPRTGQQLWSQEFDRQIADVFEIQREVALAIVGTLRASITPVEQDLIETAPTSDPEAYQLYLRATALAGNVPEQNREGIALLRAALLRDPKFGKAWSRLAWRYQWESWHGDENGAALAMEYSGQALALDPGSPDAHAARAAAYSALERVTDMRAAFARALELDPDLLFALTDGGMAASYQGDFAEGLRLSARALRRSPNVPNIRWHVGFPMLAMDDDARLEAWLDLAAAEGMQSHRLDSQRILLQAAQGKRQVALGRLGESLARWGDHPEFRDFAADVRVFLGEYPAARAELEEKFRSAPDAAGEWATSRSARTNYAFLLERLGETERAASLYEEALRYAERRIAGGGDLPLRLVEVASIHAVRGDADTAFEWLERSYAAGFRASRFLAQDPMFESLRGDRRFAELLERMVQAKARERARVDAEGIAAEVDAMIAAGPNR
jgi:TolB-like protein/tetratricopeptide (TPR) repeat protein